ARSRSTAYSQCALDDVRSASTHGKFRLRQEHWCSRNRLEKTVFVSHSSRLARYGGDLQHCLPLSVRPASRFVSTYELSDGRRRQHCEDLPGSPAWRIR